MEINPAWPMEAVKAQAIVSRTYALRSMRQNNGKNGFDLRDSVLSQVYRGINAEDKRADQAISATRGIVVFHGGNLAFTPFHSDSGGATADVTAVWGGSMPYLRGVNEPIPRPRRTPSGRSIFPPPRLRTLSARPEPMWDLSGISA